MRRLLILTWMIAAALIPALAPRAQEGKGPAARIIEPIKDFEVVAKGEKLVHTFEIANDGDQALELVEVRPACGCTVAEFDKTIAPGKTGKVKATVDTTSFEGPIAKSVSVFTNDPKNPKLQLVIRAEVRPYIGVFPGYVRYIYVQGEDIAPIPQTLWASDGEDFEIREVTSPNPELHVTFREATPEERQEDQPGRQWRLVPLLAKNAPVGALSGNIEVKTNHPKQKIVNVPISGFVRPRQHVTPQKVELGALEAGVLPLSRTLTFTNFITAGIQIQQVEVGIPTVSAEVVEVGKMDGHRFRVILTVGSEMPKGDFSTTLKLHISDAQNPVVEIPITGTVL